MEIPDFQRLILNWGRDHRRDMPWRNTRDPYEILVSEVMLQQTQVSRVLPKYEEFLCEFPTLEALADASQSSLLRIWQGLGYWNRALRLRDAARMVVNEFDGEFPRDPAALMKLPGIGPYTAGAVACFAFGSVEPFLDTNIRRVYLFFFFPGEDDVPDSSIMEVARRAVWTEDPREWGYALFDYGATELRDRAINRRSRHYSRQPAFEGSFRSFRTQALRQVLAQEGTSMSRADLKDFLTQRLATGDHPYTPEDVMDALINDGLLKISPDDRVFI
ncbi:MAG: A/G-specific adenine glycosylase [Chloroflexota bacterium]|nr:A/G-specific adenine glycosylase [Chloroflexota bacterium]